MVTHFIFLSSSYSLGTRIAMDYIVTDDSVQEKLKTDLDKILKECGKDVSISTHMIQADDTTWKSVCVADHFFKDVKVIDSMTWMLMALMIVAGIWYPAYGAMKVHPAEALHDE